MMHRKSKQKHPDSGQLRIVDEPDYMTDHLLEIYAEYESIAQDDSYFSDGATRRDTDKNRQHTHDTNRDSKDQLESIAEVYGPAFYFYCHSDPQRWSLLRDQEIRDADYGIGSVSHVQIRDSGEPIVTIRFSQETIRFNGDSFDDDAVRVSLPDSLASEIKKSYELLEGRRRKAKEAVKKESPTSIVDLPKNQFLWYMTHLENIPSIMRLGILSHSAVSRRNIRHADVSDAEVQERRRVTYEKVYGRPLHDYVPLYLNPRNPMLSKLRNRRHELVILEISPKDIGQYQCVVSDGNAASPGSDHFALDEGVNHIDWKFIRRGSWYRIEDGKRRMCAEVLVPEMVPVRHFRAIHCFSDDVKRRLDRMKVPVQVSPQLYF